LRRHGITLLHYCCFCAYLSHEKFAIYTEPFETLLLSLLIVPSSRAQLIDAGVLASTSVTVGAALSLVKVRSSSGRSSSNPTAVLFAIVSGLVLSLRNVLQRRQLTTTTQTTATMTSSANQSSKNGASPEASATTSSTMTMSTSAVAKLKKSVQSFALLSFHAGVLLAVIAVGLAVLLLPGRKEQQQWFSTISWQMLFYHPLYNIFSMVTLGFCTALTHSLLNVGKRVYAIVVAILWFREDFSPGTAVGLVAVLVGGVWYTLESKNAKSSKPTNTSSDNGNKNDVLTAHTQLRIARLSKIAAAIVILAITHGLQQQVSYLVALQ